MSLERKRRTSRLNLPPGDQEALRKALKAVAIGQACRLTPEERRKAGDTNPLLKEIWPDKSNADQEG